MTTAPDRYISFQNIDFEGNMRAVLGHLRRYIDDPAHGNAFWDRFKQNLAKIEDGSEGYADQLLLHSHTYYMAELFEDHQDETALAALKKLEVECF